MKKKRGFMAGLAVAGVIVAMAVPALAGPVGTAIGFEDDDGNLAVNSTFDWNGFAPATWSPHPATTPTRITSAPTVVSGFQFLGIEDWQATTSDSGFAGGTKQDDNCANVITAKAPNKDDLKRIYLASKTGSDGHTYLLLSWVRIPQNTTSPSAHIGFEFNQGDTGCGAGHGGLVQRTLGDMLIVYDFEGGSTDVPTLTLRRWVTSGACEISSDSPPCWGVATNLTAGGFAEGKVNTASTVVDTLTPPALSSSTGTSVSSTLGLNEFGEAGIDLTGAGVFPAGTCQSFGKAYAVSRSSGNSGTAQMKDLVGPADFTLSNCGEIKIIKHTNPRGVDQNFAFTSDISGSQLDCTQDTTPASFTLNDAGNTTDDNAANTEDCLNVPAGTYTVTEGADPSGFTFHDFSCTASGTGTSTTPTSSTTQKNVSITVAGGGSVTCTYTNNQNQGAIQVTKTRKHAADGAGDHPQSGVSFTVNGVTKQTDSNGVACFDGLAFGDYTVTETVPDGYVVDGNDKSVTVDNNAKCSDDPYVGETVSFHNTPLTDLTVSVDSQVDGGTASTIDCVDSSDNSVASGSTGANGDGSETASDLLPDTYTCTIVIDP